MLKKLALAAKEPINYHCVSNLALLVLREGACKRVAEQLQSHLHNNLLSELDSVDSMFIQRAKVALVSVFSSLLWVLWSVKFGVVLFSL